MFKVLLTTIALIAGSHAGAAVIKDGSFTGKGDWKDQAGNKGQYEADVQIQNNRISSVYRFPSSSMTVDLQLEVDNNEFFKVSMNGQEVGSGYCIGIQCHFSVTVEDCTVEETMTFYDNHLYRLGSKTEGGTLITWVEALDVKE